MFFSIGTAAAPESWRRRAGSIGLAVSLALLASSALGDEISELRERLDSQQQEIKVLQRKLEMQDEASAAASAASGVARASVKGFSIQSADGANSIRLRGILQAQGRWYPDDVTPATADGLLLRRVRPSIEGTLGEIYGFRFTTDFGGGSTIILDAYLTARFSNLATLTVGKFKPPLGLERLQSLNDIRFTERGLPSSFLPSRDIGVQLSGDTGALQYAVGYFNGAADGGRSDSFGDVENDTNGDWAARVFVQPFHESDAFALRGLGFGIGASYGKTEGSPATTLLPSYRTPGQQVFFRYRSGATPVYADGERVRLAPQGHYYIGSVGLLAEYVKVEQDVSRAVGTTLSTASLDHEAWQVAASWFLTGEEAQYRGLSPNSTFTPGKPGLGAWELAVRYHALDIDDAAFAGGADSFADPAAAASKATALGVGVNWYLNPAVKWSLNYERTRFDGSVDRDDETAVFTQFSVAF